MEPTLSQIFCMSSTREHVEDAMDLRSGSIIIVKSMMPQRRLRKRILHIREKMERWLFRSRNQTGIWTYPFSGSTSIQSESSATWRGTKEIPTRTTYWGGIKVLSQRQPVPLLYLNTRKKSEMSLAHQVIFSDRSRSAISYFWKSDGNRQSGEQSLDRRRLLHLRQLVGIANDGKNERHQWQGRGDWHEWWEWDEWIQISSTVKSLFQISCQSIRCWFFSVDFAYRH